MLWKKSKDPSLLSSLLLSFTLRHLPRPVYVCCRKCKNQVAFVEDNRPLFMIYLGGIAPQRILFFNRCSDPTAFPMKTPSYPGITIPLTSRINGGDPIGLLLYIHQLHVLHPLPPFTSLHRPKLKISGLLHISPSRTPSVTLTPIPTCRPIKHQRITETTHGWQRAQHDYLRLRLFRILSRCTYLCLFLVAVMCCCAAAAAGRGDSANPSRSLGLAFIY